MNKRAIEKRLERLEEGEELTIEDLPAILMQNLREEYGYAE